MTVDAWTKAKKAGRYVGQFDVYLASPLEWALLSLCRCEVTRPPVFIMGLPRSGTTLVYQYIVHRLRVSYFTNGIGRYFMSPCLITWLQHERHGTYRSGFESSYGSIEGKVAPHEAGKFWGRFFGFDDYVSYGATSSRAETLMRRTIACTERVFGTVPFVNKNVKHILRIDALSHIFPNAIFVVVERNRADVGLSLLRARYDNLENPRNWWSVKPPNYEQLKDLPIVEQIANQIKYVDRKLQKDLSNLADERLVRIEYESFCEKPEVLISRLRSALKPIDTRNQFVDHFTPSRNSPQTEQERHLLEKLRAERLF